MKAERIRQVLGLDEISLNHFISFLKIAMFSKLPSVFKQISTVSLHGLADKIIAIYLEFYFSLQNNKVEIWLRNQIHLDF